MTAGTNYHKPPKDPRTIGGGLKAHGRARCEKLMTMINSRPRSARRDLLPTMELQTVATADLKMPKHLRSAADDGIADTCNRRPQDAQAPGAQA